MLPNCLNMSCQLKLNGMFPLHSHPQGSTGSSTFLGSDYNPKISASNSLYFSGIATVVARGAECHP